MVLYLNLPYKTKKLCLASRVTRLSLNTSLKSENLIVGVNNMKTNKLLTKSQSGREKYMCCWYLVELEKDNDARLDLKDNEMNKLVGITMMEFP